MLLAPEVKLVRTRNSYYLFNTLTGAIDQVDRQIYDDLALQWFEDLPLELREHLMARHYLFPDEQSYRQFKTQTMAAVDELELRIPPNFVVVTTFACNLRCHYCYQGLDKDAYYMDDDVIDAMFRFIDDQVDTFPYWEGRPKRPLISLMGGEFLIPSREARVMKILRGIQDRGYEPEIITNGVALDYYSDKLLSVGVNEVQVTLDGTKEYHDRRRVFVGGQGSFDRIVKSLHVATKAGLNIVLRVNIDSENVEDLPNLGRFLINSGLMSTGRIYAYIYGLSEGGCTGYVPTLPETELIRRVYQLWEEYPEEMGVFHWAFHGWDQVSKAWTNQPYVSKNRYCAATKNQWVLGPDGSLYTCFFGVGRLDYKVGTFYPEVHVEDSFVHTWRHRSVTTIVECNSCSNASLCGGGCTYKAYDKTGKILCTSCSDYNELVPIFFDYLEQRQRKQVESLG